MYNTENLSQKENHSSGLIYFMPSFIFEAEELSNTEKLLYSLLSGLAHGNEEKTCFPSDDYISKRLKISKEQANRSVASLCKFGVISKKIISDKRNPFIKRRIITVYLQIQKSFTNCGKDQSRLCGKAQVEIIKNIKNISNKLDMQKAGDDPPPGFAAAQHFSNLSKKNIMEEKHLKQAEYFQAKVDELKIPRKKPDMAKEANEMRLLCEKDGVDFKEVKPVIDWLFSQSFWQEKGVLPMKSAKFRKDFGKYLQQFRKRNDTRKGFEPSKGWENYQKNQELAEKNCRARFGMKNFEALKTCLKQKYGAKESISYDLPVETFKEIFEKWWNARQNELKSRKTKSPFETSNQNGS